jgi:hypothetical protein
MGLTYARSTDPVEEAQELSRLQEVLHAFKHLDELIERMGRVGEIVRSPAAAEITSIRTRLFSLVMSGVFSGAEHEMKDVIFSAAPPLRPPGQRMTRPVAQDGKRDDYSAN